MNSTALKKGRVRDHGLPDSGDAIVDTQLVSLRPFFGRVGVQEIVAVRPGELRLEINGGWQVESAPELTVAKWQRLASALAAWTNQSYVPETQPLVSCRLPGGHRWESCIGPQVETGVGVSIRISRPAKFGPEDFGVSGELGELVRAAVERGDNILVAGGTSSGKTTLLNSMVQWIPVGERILAVEDAYELRIPHANQERLMVNRNDTSGALTYSRAFDHFMRSRPDRLALGELSIPNAFAALLFLDSGHKGFMATLHCNGAKHALDTAFWFRLSLAGMTMDKAALSAFLHENIDLVLYVSRHNGRREVTEYFRPKLHRDPVVLAAGSRLEAANV
jgi:type IV secretory pathway ATPase VirB11/archaellum biosynthesis ATPase